MQVPLLHALCLSLLNLEVFLRTSAEHVHLRRMPGFDDWS